MTIPQKVQKRAEFVLSEHVTFLALKEFLDDEDHSYHPQYYDYIDEVCEESFSELKQIQNEYPKIDITENFNNPIENFKENSDIDEYFENIDELDSIRFYAFAEAILHDTTIRISSSEVIVEYIVSQDS